MNYYEADKIEILDRIEIIVNTITARLLPTFDSIEEAKRIEEARLSELVKIFNPDTMDVGSCYEDAFSKAGQHYMIQNEMKQEFLNHQATLLFHIFEKDCQKMCFLLNDNGTALKEKLEELGIATNANSHWYKINKELRLVSNVIKHGKGRSYDDLKILREDLFKDNFGFLVTSDLEISLDDIKNYGIEMKFFWMEFFNVVLPKYQ
ncbi:MAG: hypothetical protein M0P43_00665 [Arcobacteraceae bacterium]|nr:hypothetical protein [Arcobacteraceae bacterium]